MYILPAPLFVYIKASPQLRLWCSKGDLVTGMLTVYTLYRVLLFCVLCVLGYNGATVNTSVHWKVFQNLLIY